MKLGSSVSYAVSILIQVLREGADGPVTATRISKGCRFPPRFLYRVLHRLVEAGLLHAVSGPGGGYMLARKPRAISLLDIVVAVEGPSTIAPLVAACPKHKRAIAAINKAAGEIAARTDRELEKIKLSRLIQER